MDTAKVFKTGRSQAIRLPKEYRFNVDEVIVNRVGETVVLYAPGKGWDLLASAYGKATPDFMQDRNQPGKAERRKRL